jgi:hypothetical protein
MSETKPRNNKYAGPALLLGCVSVLTAFLFVTPIAAIILGVLGVVRSGELKAEGIKSTGKASSVSGLVLGSLYLLAAFYQVAIGRW